MLLIFLMIWVATAFGLWLTTHLISGVNARSTRALWLAALLLGLINAFIRPIFFWLTLPLTVLTFGAFALVINALMIKLVSWFVPDFEVRGFGSALLAALVLALLGLAALLLLTWALTGIGGGLTLPGNGMQI